MKKRDVQELHTKTIPELASLVKETRQSIADMRLEKAQMKLKNTTYLDRMKDKLAIMLTIKRGKEMSQNA